MFYNSYVRTSHPMLVTLHHKNKLGEIFQFDFKFFMSTHKFPSQKFSIPGRTFTQPPYRGSIFLDMELRVLWQSIARKHPMYERICDSLFFGDGGSKTVKKVEKVVRHKFSSIYDQHPARRKNPTHPSVSNDRTAQPSSLTPSCAFSRNSRDHPRWFYYLHERKSYPSTEAAWTE